MKGQRPRSKPGHKWGKDVLEHPLLAELRTFLGMFSDSDAHFTPEFEGSLQWSENVRGREVTFFWNTSTRPSASFTAPPKSGGDTLKLWTSSTHA